MRPGTIIQFVGDGDLYLILSLGVERHKAVCVKACHAYDLFREVNFRADWVPDGITWAVIAHKVTDIEKLVYRIEDL